MKIKLFYQKYKQALWDLESQVNVLWQTLKLLT
ncbi:Uncharacterised protein [Streptococcus pneumoniae]|nr:Uncharacterised protein [Streptococcus pneumoniae]